MDPAEHRDKLLEHIADLSEIDRQIEMEKTALEGGAVYMPWKSEDEIRHGAQEGIHQVDYNYRQGGEEVEYMDEQAYPHTKEAPGGMAERDYHHPSAKFYVEKEDEEEADVADRLMKAGQEYEERRRKMRLDVKMKEMEEEDRIRKDASTSKQTRSLIAKQGMGDNYAETFYERTPVEERLQMYNEKYMNKRIEKARELRDDEERCMKKPEIDMISERIVANMPRIPKVEDRLISTGEKSKLQKEEKIKKTNIENKKQAVPKISESAQKMTRDGKPIADRLYEFKNKYSDKKHNLAKKYTEDKKYPFQPNVNKKLNDQLAERSQIRTKEGISYRKKAIEEKETHQPQLSKKSMIMATKLGPSEDRLLNPKEKHLTPSDEPSFAPQINQISSELDNRARFTKEGKPAGRWEALYELDQKRKEDMNNLRKVYAETKEKEETYSFQPTLVAIGSPLGLERGDRGIVPVVARNEQWVKKKEEKLNKLKAQMESEGTEECTFKPKLIAQQRIKEEFENNSADQTANETAEVINAMKSIENYINKQKEFKLKKDSERKKDAEYVGSGKLWQNKITLPKGPKWTEKSENRAIRSLQKPVTSKVQGDSGLKHHSMYPKSEMNKFIQPNRDVEAYAKGGGALGSIQETSDMGSAMDLLHAQLMNINLENPNFKE